ncbi:filamentous hemagglutinin N-terminal domain-containing protein [Burkholderia cenocepacia]|uniref:GLUG motif-containing protein n=1 Tax=Burkholderia cenocepacia TaxID=95486 RepID=UPI001CF3E8C0|nr:GLUG motif-containing protein [Burkholderia cenocepacia]MCA7921143.1 filamentous hemagglutinin N-terminal domain-containing protein [Burkholderia cenocepacia]
MNKTYALVWNQTQGCWSAVGETARRRGKSAGGKRLAAAAVSLLGFAALPAFALPTGEVITSGQGDIVRDAGGKSMSINQHSDKLVTNWQDFSVAGGERVSFHQPGSQSIALNRVVGNNGSQIHGQIDANGKVFLVNPNGVLFGAGAQINVGGLVASTQNIADADFLAGNYRFAGNSNASIVNDGKITAADGGSVALLGARVSNNGVIQAKMGRVALGAGNAFNVNFDGNGLLNLQVEGGAVDAQATNGGLLKADGGEVLMTARAAGNLLSAVVNNAGTIEAKGLSGNGGKITLDGGTVHVAGKLDASATAGRGGEVLTRGEQVTIASTTRVDTRGLNGQTGSWKIEAANAGVADESNEVKTRGFNGNSNVNGNTGSANGNGNVDIGHGKDGEGENGGQAIGENVGGQSNGAGQSNGGRSIGTGALARNLDTTNIELVNTQGDLTVAAPVSWASDNALTLTSQKGNVDLQKAVTATGENASLVVNAADRIRVKDAVKLTGHNAHLELNSKNGHTLENDIAVTLSGDNASFRSNGEDYKVLHTVEDLRDIDNGLNGRYVLGNAIDGANARFRSIGGNRAFSGVFDGLGNRIQRLSVYNTTPNVGLFAQSTGTLANLTLDSLTVDGSSANRAAFVGGLVGDNLGRISNVTAKNMTVSYNGKQATQMGGLVGRNLGAIERVRFEGRVAGSGYAFIVGGLVGSNAGTITDGHVVADVALTGAAPGLYPDAARIGGLVGMNSGVITHASASGRVTARDNTSAGGFVGENRYGVISHAHARVAVTAGKNGDVGGFAGRQTGGTIEHASASGMTTAAGANTIGGFIGRNDGGMLADVTSNGDVSDITGRYIGGLAGVNAGTIIHANATGNVKAGNAGEVGGLVGLNNRTLEDAHANVNVTAGNGSRVGGLVGTNDGSIRNASASGTVKGGSTSDVGGLVGLNTGEIDSAKAEGNVVAGTNSRAGGLVGTNRGGRALIHRASASGDVTAARSDVGGLTGINDANARIEDATSSGTIGGESSILGGLVARNAGTIRSSNSTAKLARQTYYGEWANGMLVGLNTGVIESSSAVGAVGGNFTVGFNLGSIDGDKRYGPR